MENWTNKAVSALYIGQLVHKNNWHAIKADPRFGPWLVDFSADDLRNKVKAYQDMFATHPNELMNPQQIGLNQEGLFGVNQPKNICQKILADPKYGPVLSGFSEDDLKNKIMADLEFFGVNRSTNDCRDKRFMKNWTEKAVSALYVGNLVHKNNWHAIKADPRFGPWLVDFSANDLRNKVKADKDVIAKVQPTGLNQEGMSGVNQPKNIWQKIKAHPQYGSILSGRSEDDIKNKFEADLEFFGVNLSANDCRDKVNDDAETFENWKTNEAFALFLGVIKYGKNNWDAIKADSHFGPLLVERDAYSCSLKYQHDLDKLERDILVMQQHQQAGLDTDVPEPVRARGAGGETSRGARARGKKKGKGCRR